jgi:hypothetical protein
METHMILKINDGCGGKAFHSSEEDIPLGDVPNRLAKLNTEWDMRFNEYCGILVNFEEGAMVVCPALSGRIY